MGGGGGKGSSGQPSYGGQLSGDIGGYLHKNFSQPTKPNINVPAMGDLTKQISGQIPIASFQNQQALKVDPNQFKTLQDMGTEQIAQGAKASQQDVLRQFAQRGLGNSGLAAQGVIDQYKRGAGQQSSDLARQLQSQRLGLEFGEAQKARDLNAQLGQTAAQLNLQRGLGIGQLGLGEQAQNLAGQQAQFQQQNYLLPYAAALAQSQIGAAANQQGKGGGKG